MSIATYEEVLDLPNHPEKLLVDVRGADELVKTGKIPTSINIPLPILEQFNFSTDEFTAKYGRDKLALESELIFHCNRGGRAQKGTDLAVSLGYTKFIDRYLHITFNDCTSNYKGSWTEWAKKQGK